MVDAFVEIDLSVRLYLFFLVYGQPRLYFLELVYIFFVGVAVLADIDVVHQAVVIQLGLRDVKPLLPNQLELHGFERYK